MVHQTGNTDTTGIISREVNYLMNTKHPDFSKVFIVEVNSFIFDKRIKS